MKILFFLNDVRFVNSFGGVELVACSFANEFVNRGNDVTIVCNNPENGRPVRPLNPKVRLINLNGSGRKKRYVPFYIELLRGILWPLRKTFPGKSLDSWRQELKQKKIAKLLNPILQEDPPDLILSFFNEGLTTLYYSSAADSVPIIQMFHSTPSRAIRYKSRILSRMLCRCEAVQVLQPEFVSELDEYGPLNIEVIPNAVEFPLEKIDYKDKRNGRIICLGRLEPGKRQHLLIDSFLQVAKDFPDWTLHFFGEARKHYFKRLKNRIPAEMIRRQIFFEETTQESQKELLSSDIFGFPSAFEGFPLALCEAMALGLPALGFQNAPGINSLIVDNENGFLASDRDDYTEKLRLLMKNAALRRRLGERGKESMQQYAPEKIWNQWDELFQNILAKKARTIK
ncbi:MAG: glycosyltransferase [Planctomycetia bacterium]|nr:glycosyltransferase [Planctomycetia bacterium]